MANTYTQINIHAVFAVQNRAACINTNWKEEMHKYISGIVSNNNHKVLAINSMPDHVHLLFGLRPAQSLSDLLQDVKGDSSRWINERKFCRGLFRWQEGFGAFAIGMKDVHKTIHYIQTQEQHHRTVSFREEYEEFLRENGIEFNEKYVFSEMLEM
jgi:putative transposase